MLSPDSHTSLRVGVTILSLVEGDITEMDVDAIVNPANSSLTLGGGVAGAIRARGGPSIQTECHRIGSVPVGSAVITTGGNLRARHVIHAVGPRMGEGDEDRKLAEATHNALQVASDHELTSIALPAISTGIFGYPKMQCAELMLRTTVDFVSGRKTSLRKVAFCLYGNDTFDVFQAQMEKLRDELQEVGKS